jgi:hypothetical protein
VAKISSFLAWKSEKALFWSSFIVAGRGIDTCAKDKKELESEIFGQPVPSSNLLTDPGNR